MKITSRRLYGVPQTLRWMHYMARKYRADMSQLASMPPTELFIKLANIPFVEDHNGDEELKRPKYTLNWGGDCDCKAIAAAAYAINLSIPFRFCATGRKIPGKRRIPLTHVFAEFKIGSKWVPFDCTYSFHIYGQRIESDRSMYM